MHLEIQLAGCACHKFCAEEDFEAIFRSRETGANVTVYYECPGLWEGYPDSHS